MIALCLLFLMQPLELTNPRALLLRLGIERMPREMITYRYNPAPDIGAYEHWPPYEPVGLGDLSFDRRVDIDDYHWFALCWDGPGAPCRTQLRHIESRVYHSAACWLADLDDDGDVDLKDYSQLLGLMT